ncbi:hypothetical protein Hanom_Chr11g01043991 [Helianthus anomalus]
MNWLITNGLVWAFEYLRQSGSFTSLLDLLSTAAYQSGQHDGVYTRYHECQGGSLLPSMQRGASFKEIWQMPWKRRVTTRYLHMLI